MKRPRITRVRIIAAIVLVLGLLFWRDIYIRFLVWRLGWDNIVHVEWYGPDYAPDFQWAGQRLFDIGEPVIPYLVDVLKSDRSTISSNLRHGWAHKLLAYMPYPSAAPLLRDLAQETKDPEVFFIAERILRDAHGDTSCFKIIASLVRHPDPKVRDRAISVLFAYPRQDFLLVVRELLNDNDAEIRHTTVCKFGGHIGISIFEPYAERWRLFFLENADCNSKVEFKKRAINVYLEHMAIEGADPIEKCARVFGYDKFNRLIRDAYEDAIGALQVDPRGILYESEKKIWEEGGECARARHAKLTEWWRQNRDYIVWRPDPPYRPELAYYYGVFFVDRDAKNTGTPVDPATGLPRVDSLK